MQGREGEDEPQKSAGQGRVISQGHAKQDAAKFPRAAVAEGRKGLAPYAFNCLLLAP